MKLTLAPLVLASLALMAKMHQVTAGTSSSSCSSATSSCLGTLSFFTEAIIDVNEIAKCTNGQYPYISSFDFRSDNDGFSYQTTYRTSSGTLATAFDCTSSQNLVRSYQSVVQCGVGSTGGLQIKFTCNNLVDSCEISWAFGVVCPTPASTGNGATSSAVSTVAVTATGQAAALVLPALGAAVAMQV